MPTPVLLEVVPSSPAQSVDYQTVCFALTRCVLLPLGGALPSTNCSLLVDPATFKTELTVDGVRTIRATLRAINADADFIFSEGVRTCCENFLALKVERVAMDTDESAEYALEALAALLCLVLVVVGIQKFKSVSAPTSSSSLVI